MIVRHFGVGLAAVLFFSASGMAAVADSAPGDCMNKSEPKMHLVCTVDSGLINVRQS